MDDHDKTATASYLSNLADSAMVYERKGPIFASVAENLWAAFQGAKSLAVYLGFSEDEANRIKEDAKTKPTLAEIMGGK
jgi:hypothetical protein